MRLLILFFILAAATSDGQPLLTPSKKAFEKKWLQPRNYLMHWYSLTDTSKKEIGKVYTHVSIQNNLLTVITEVRLNGMPGLWTDTSIAHARTLKPVLHSSYNMQRDMTLNFGKNITGYYTDKMKKSKTVINDTVSSWYFDSNLYPLLVGLLPLTEGYNQDIAIYDYNPAAKKGIMKAAVQNVTSGALLTEKNGVRDVWIVTVTDEISNSRSTYYFDKNDRKLWKQEMEAKGRRMAMILDEM